MADITGMDIDPKGMDRSDVDLNPLTSLLTSNSHCMTSDFSKRFLDALYDHESRDYSCSRMRAVIDAVKDCDTKAICQLYHLIQGLYTQDTQKDLQVAIDDLLTCIALRLYVDKKLYSNREDVMDDRRIRHLKWVDHMRHELIRALSAQYYGYDVCINFRPDMSIN